MGPLNPVTPLPSGDEGGAVYEPFDPNDPYPVTLSKIRATTVEAARNFMTKLENGHERNYKWGGSELHGTDCGGLVYRVLFSHSSGKSPDKRENASGYFSDAQKTQSLIDNPLHHPPQPGDVFFYKDHSRPTPTVSHMGFIEQCRENSGELSCSILSAAGKEGCPDITDSRCRVVRDKIRQDSNGNWSIDYNADGKEDEKKGPNAYFFADSLKMRGIPSPEEVNPLGGVDLDVPFPLDSSMLGMGELKGFKLSADGTTITLYASKSEADLQPQEGVFQARGVNLADVQEILNSLYRTGGQAPSFTLLPDAASAAAINGALAVAKQALQGFDSPEVGQLLYGESVWHFLGVQNPASFTMQAIFSDPALRNTHVGDVLMASDLLLKTLAMGDQGHQTPTPYFKRADALIRGGENPGTLEASRFWFQADPASFVIRKITAPDGSAVYDFADMQLHVSCRPVQFGGSESNITDTAEACEPGSLSSWYADSLNDETTMEEIINHHPILEELKELYKAVVVAKILYQNGFELSGSFLDSSEGSPWETSETAEFLPVFYVGQPVAGGSPVLLATGGGGVNVDVQLSEVVRQGGVLPDHPFYLQDIKAPIGDVSENVRALRIKLKNKPSGGASNPTWGLSLDEIEKRFGRLMPNPLSAILNVDEQEQIRRARAQLSFSKLLYPDDPIRQQEPLRKLATHFFFKILLAKNPADREKPLRGLIDIGPEVVVPMLIEKLRGENPLTPDIAPFEREFAAAILGYFGPSAAEALPALKQALSDSDPLVREKATEALKQIDPANYK